MKGIARRLWLFYWFKTWQIRGKFVTLVLRGPRWWLWFCVKAEPGDFMLRLGPVGLDASDFPF